jgi:putative ABC transport system permease protein
MHRNYIKIAIRNICRQKLSTFVNVIGLAIGLAGCLLIISYVSHELSFENCHKKANNIYRVDGSFTEGDLTIYSENMMPPLAQALENEYAYVHLATTFKYISDMKVSVGQNKYTSDQVLFAQPQFFEMFTFPFLDGNPRTSLKAPYTAVISKEFKERVFGEQNPLGKSIQINDEYQCLITGVLKELPRNTQFRFDFLISHATLSQLDFDPNNWEDITNDYVYVFLEKRSDAEKLTADLPSVLAQHLPPEEVQKYHLRLSPLKDIYLHSSYFEELSPQGNLFYVYLLTGIAVLILIIACINYINLSTARSFYRLKEVGMRKVLGANRRQLILQMLTESVIVTMVAMSVGLILYEVGRPFCNDFIGKPVVAEIYNNPTMIFSLIILTLIVGVVAGSYTAFYQTRLKPLKLFYHKSMVKSSKSILRKSLVTLQFVIAVGMIFVCLVIHKQIHYLKSYDRGFESDNIMVLNLAGEDAGGKCALLKNEILNQTDIRNATIMFSYPGESSLAITAFTLEGGQEQNPEYFQSLFVDRDYLSTFKIDLIEGRNFSDEHEGNPYKAVIVNQSLIDKCGISDPLNYTLYYKMKPVEIIGVVRDFNSLPMKIKLMPTVLMLETAYNRQLALKLDADKITGQTLAVKSIWSQVLPDKVFSYFFLDDKLDSVYQEEEKMRSLFLVSSVLAILIACLGAFGLASFATEQRAHEIGIRKVLGASLLNIIRLTSKEFLVLIGVACIIAWPLAYYLINKSLQDFPYRTAIGFEIFVLSGLACLLIVLATVSYQSLKAALANPVNSLRHE